MKTDWKMLARELAINFAVILLFALVGAFGTGADFSFAERLGYWGIIISTCAVSFHAGMYAVLRKGLFTMSQRALRIVGGCALASAPPSLVIVAMERLTRPDNNSVFWWIWICVFILGIGICLLRFMPAVWRVEFSGLDRTVDTEYVPFLKRLSVETGTKLLSVSVEDHYVRVTTQRGSAMILLSFREALDELKNYPGLQIHRSHWIAADALENVERAGRAHRAVLTDGRDLPVSKTFFDKAKVLERNSRREIDRAPGLRSSGSPERAGL